MREWNAEIVDEDLDFMEEEPTIRCGEGGCRACDDAFHRSCDPILRAYPITGGDFVEADKTSVDLLPYGATFDDPELEYDLGGEG